MKSFKIIFFFLLIINNIFQVSYAEVRDFPNLKEANETPGDRIYNISDTVEQLQSSLIPMAQGTLTVQGTGANSVLSGVIQGTTQQGHFFKLTGTGSTLNLKDFTIQDASKTNAEGSVVLIYAGNILNLNKMVIQNNKTTDYGGGAISATNAVLNIFDSKFINNSSNVSFKDDTSDPDYPDDIDAIKSSAGAILVRGDKSETVIDNTLFENNSAYLTGAMFIDRGNLQLTNSIFKGNYSTTTTLDGGNPGALRLGSGDSISLIENCIFENNHSNHNAGAVYSYGNTTIRNTEFKGNTASYRGGALINGGGANTTITGSSFENNEADENAGAIYNDGNLNIDNTIIKNNIAKHHIPTDTEGNGGAIYNSSRGVINLNAGTQINSNSSEGVGGAIANSGGIINITGTKIDGNNSATNGGAIWTSSSATTNIKGGTSITNNSTTGNGGAIYNQGSLYLTSNKNGDILFDGNKSSAGTNDIFGRNSSSTNINRIYVNGNSGIVMMKGGFGGQGDIQKSNKGSLILGGDSSQFSGTYTQTDGTTAITNGKWFGGTSTINGGTLQWDKDAQKVTGILKVNQGNLNIVPDAVLDLNNTNDIVSADAVVYLSKDAQLNNQGTVTFNNNDIWNGTVRNTGVLTFDNFNKTSGSLYQTGGNLNLHNNSVLSTDKNNFITGGNLLIDGNSRLNITDQNFTVNNLKMDNGVINAINGKTAPNYIKNDFTIGKGGAKFNIDFDGDTKKSDQFIVSGDFVPSGEVTIDNYAVYGTPTDKQIDFSVFTGGNIGKVIFTAIDDEVSTPIYMYKLLSTGSGYYSLVRQEFNPSIERGVQTSESVFLNNLMVTNLIFEHVYIDSEEMADLRNNIVNYGDPQYAPYQQFDNEEGSIWLKPFVSYDRFTLKNNNTLFNTAYGSILGFDFPTQQINEQWKFLPTVFITYQGARQAADGNNYYQNGGMGGFMGTFFRGESISSFMAYGGGYGNEMYYDGYRDETGNWYAGCVAISAYNFHPKKNIIIQPILWSAYNIVGKQTWTADYGSVPMSTGYLNGLAIVPGVNAFYGSDTWSVYGTISYLFTINDRVTASAGPVNLQDARLEYGFLQYGVGFIKKIKDRFLAYGQVTIRNGGLTGIAFWGGLSYRF